MDRLIQIIYISQSSFVPATASVGIEPNVARILAKSRANNRKLGLVGVLYFGDGCFFQCLEGTETEIDKLYEKLKQDPRHKNLKLISRKLIKSLSFPDWAMKYVPLEAKLNELLQTHGYRSFDPYKFDALMTENVLKLLQASMNVDIDTHAPLPSSDDLKINKPGNRLAIMTLMISLLSLAISIFTLTHG